MASEPRTTLTNAGSISGGVTLASTTSVEGHTYHFANRVIVGTIIARALRAPLERSSLGQLRAEVSQRVVFAECSSSGRLVSELEANGRAAQEIRMLAEEIQGIAS